MQTNTEQLTDEQFKSELSGFYGTEQWYRSPYGFLYTDGVNYVLENGGRDSNTAYWLLDIVFSYQTQEKIRNERFQTYTFVRKGDGLDLTITHGNETILGTQNIEYSDLRVDELKLWFVDRVLMLPSEY